MPRLEAAMQTCIGSRPSNQDRMFARINPEQTCGLFCVADGMGGLKDGHLAAEIAVGRVADWWDENLPRLHGQGSANTIYAELRRLFQAINSAIIAQSGEHKKPLGTTLSLLFICNASYYIAHTGDTRIYLARKRLFCTAYAQLTEDHTWGAGKLREGFSLQEIKINPQRNTLTSCLGIFEEPRVSTAMGNAGKNTAFLLCSDGLYRMVGRKTMAKMAINERSPAILADSLINLAETSGAKDNASVVVVRVG